MKREGGEIVFFYIEGSPYYGRDALSGDVIG